MRSWQLKQHNKKEDKMEQEIKEANIEHIHSLLKSMEHKVNEYFSNHYQMDVNKESFNDIQVFYHIKDNEPCYINRDFTFKNKNGLVNMTLIGKKPDNYKYASFKFEPKLAEILENIDGDIDVLYNHENNTFSYKMYPNTPIVLEYKYPNANYVNRRLKEFWSVESAEDLKNWHCPEVNFLNTDPVLAEYNKQKAYDEMKIQQDIDFLNKGQELLVKQISDEISKEICKYIDEEINKEGIAFPTTYATEEEIEMWGKNLDMRKQVKEEFKYLDLTQED